MKFRHFAALCLGFVGANAAMSSFELHNINAAHAQGYTGQGVNIGIVDTIFNENHELLAGKFITPPLNNGIYNDPDGKDHGNHVAGIAAGATTDGKYYGIAKDAQILGYGNFGTDSSYRAIDFSQMLTHNVRVINNSHTGFHSQFATFAKQNNSILVVYATGNYSGLSPIDAASRGIGSSGGTNANANNYNIAAWLAVGNVNSGWITPKADGSLEIHARAIGGSASTNLCGDAKGYCVMAAGTDIMSAAYQSDKLVENTGTSMAAPAVTGIAAIVASKYPFLTGKQLADVILSTTNKNFTTPKVIYKREEDQSGKIIQTHIIYIGDSQIPQKNGTNDNAQILKDLQDAYGASNIASRKITVEGSIVTHKSVEQVFGQGIVDAEAALKGLAEIDINRLSDTDRQTLTSTEYAYYTIDTQGQSGVFTNDIKQKKWDANYQNANSNALLGSTMGKLDAGLLKKGSGTLSFSGHLLYLGATVVQGGEIRLIDGARTAVSAAALNETPQILASGAQTLSTSVPLNVSGEVLVQNAGTLSVDTDTNIAKSLTNEGVVNVGVSKVSTLSVGETYTQKAGAALRLGFLVDSATNSALKAKTYEIDTTNTTLIYKPLSASVANRRVDFNLLGLEKELGKFSEIKLESSGALSYTLLANNAGVIIGSPENIYADFEGANESLAVVLRAMSINSASLNADYKDFFATLNDANTPQYRAMLANIDEKPHLEQNELLLLAQGANTLDAVLNLQGGEGYFIKPKYARLATQSLTARALGTRLHATKGTSFGAISGFLDYGYLASSEPQRSAHAISLGLGAKNDFGTAKQKGVGLFGGASFGAGLNSVQKAPSELNFAAFIISAYAGVDRDFDFGGTSVVPTAFVSYHLFRQDKISDSGLVYNGANLFARQIEPKNSHFVSANLGLNLRQNLADTLNLNAYGFYERRILGDEMQSEAEFYDFSGKFTQKLALGTDYARFGLALNYETPKPKKPYKMVRRGYKFARVPLSQTRYFLSLAAQGELSLSKDSYKGFGASLRGGVRF